MHSWDLRGGQRRCLPMLDPKMTLEILAMMVGVVGLIQTANLFIALDLQRRVSSLEEWARGPKEDRHAHAG